MEKTHNNLDSYHQMGFVFINKKGIIEEINLTANEMLGYFEDEVPGKLFADFLLISEVPKFIKLLELSYKNYEPFASELKLNTKSGYIIINLICVPFTEKDSQAKYYKLYFNDISKRKKDKKTIDESEKRFRLMADNSPVMLWMTDAENNLEYMNKTKLNFLGKDFENLKNNGWVETRHPEDKEKFLKALSESALERKNFSIEIRVKDRNGNYRWLLDSAAPRFTEDGSFTGFIGSGIDVTEQKNFRISLEKSLKEKEVLLTEIHHRVKNNLQIISSLLSLQASNIKDENILSMFQTSKDRIRSMAILHEKLYQSKDIHEVNFKEYINELLSYLFDSYNLNKIKLNLNIVNVKMSIEYCLTLGLIMNELVSNSLKHAFKGIENGEITIELFWEENNVLKLRIMDNGIGLPENYEIEKGNTLGLILVKTLVEQHHGSMEIKRNGKTEFEILFNYKGD